MYQCSRQRARKLTAANSLSKAADDSYIYRRERLECYARAAADGFDGAKQKYAEDTAALLAKTKDCKAHLDNLFRFCNDTFGTGQELIIVLTEVAVNPNTSRFIAAYGCDEYYRYDKELMFHERRLTILDELESLKKQEDNT